MKLSKSVIMIGATGAVGGEVLKELLRMPEVEAITLLGRRPVEGIEDPRVRQFTVDVADPASYKAHIPGHDAAISTLGVGEPSKVSKEDFIKIDKDMTLAFASACRAEGVKHFELLSSVGVSPSSSTFYLRTKGELEDGLKALEFERLSLFHPSMILTPTNRYGLAQGLTLAVWPKLNLILQGPGRKLRGVPVAQLGGAIARNTQTPGEGVEVLEWDDFKRLKG